MACIGGVCLGGACDIGFCSRIYFLCQFLCLYILNVKLHPTYYPQPMLEAAAQLGDFLVEVSGYNEGKFQQLGTSVPTAGMFPYRISKETESDWPTFFSIEYKLTHVHISYLGEESLAGQRIRVTVSSRNEGSSGSAQGNSDSMQGNWDSAQAGSGDRQSPQGNSQSSPNKEQGNSNKVQGNRNESQGWAMREETPSEDGTGEPQISSYGYSDSNGNSNVVFDGAELMAGEPRLVHGGGNGFMSAGDCWKPDDQISVHVWIYVDDTLAAEGDV